MKRSILFSSVLCLLLGLLIGSLLPAPWDKPSVPSVPVLSNGFSNSAPSVSNSVGTQTTPDETSLEVVQKIVDSFDYSKIEKEDAGETETETASETETETETASETETETETETASETETETASETETVKATPKK